MAVKKKKRKKVNTPVSIPYKQARLIAQTLEPGQTLEYALDQGAAIRAALRMFEKRHPNPGRIIATKRVGNRIKIWRRV